MMTDDKTLVARLRAACDGNPYAKIPWPHRVLHEAADRIEALEKDNAELRHDIARHVAAVAAERSAALEEAARVAEAVDPEKPTAWLYPRHKIAFAIRALKEPT